MPIDVTDAAFENDVLSAPGPVLVDFWAPWCGPCKQMAPSLSALAEKFAGGLTVAKVNIDENPDVPVKYGVRGIPTMMIFDRGAVVATRVGAMPAGKLEEWVQETLDSHGQKPGA